MERVVVEVETKTKENINWINSNGLYLALMAPKVALEASCMYMCVCIYIFNKLICKKPNKCTYRWNYNYFIYLFSKVCICRKKNMFSRKQYFFCLCLCYCWFYLMLYLGKSSRCYTPIIFLVFLNYIRKEQ